MATTPFVLTDTQKVNYTLTAVDADNNPATLATGATVAVTSSGASATIVPDATPVAGSIASGFIVASATLGTVQINAAVTNADGSAGPTGSTSVQVVAGAAASITFSLGTAVSQ